jgi:hypothetical protein
MSDLILKPLEYDKALGHPTLSKTGQNELRKLSRLGPVVFATLPSENEDERGLEMVICASPEQKITFLRVGIPFSQVFTLREIVELLEITQSDPADASAILSLMRQSEDTQS